ncbi:DUF6229 family protein [Dyella sp. 20L07]|uniref:DUF6229 family protein n=1 Tax=Dyella sp. 20L07 TaxID=3384240 RepID=UPI003D2947D2
MQQTDEMVSSWLSGEDSYDGYANPAGPLYIEGAAATEAALTNAASNMLISAGTTCSTCSAHLGGGCSCC